MQVDVRYSTAAQLAELDAFVREIAAKTFIEGTETEVALISERPATELCEKNLALFAEINEILVEAGFPAYGEKHGLGGTDMAYVTQYGIPCIDSFGVRGGNIHSIKEYMVLDSLAEMAKQVALLVVKL